MARLALLLCAALPAAAALAAPVPSVSRARASGRVLKAEVKWAKGKNGPVLSEGRITVADDAGRLEQFQITRATKVTCDGVKVPAFEKAAVPGQCDRATSVVYDPKTKKVFTLELKTPVKADADEAKTWPAVSGEVASTDVLAGKISVRLGGGAMMDFAVGEGTKILREAEGKPAQPIPLEAVQVGDRVEVRSADWKTADELHVRAPAR